MHLNVDFTAIKLKKLHSVTMSSDFFCLVLANIKIGLSLSLDLVASKC